MEKRKTALVLGGGGSRGAYEIGVWQALRELGIPIDIVTGTSVGAINGAMITQDAFDFSVSLWKEIDTSMVFETDVKDIIANFGIGNKGLRSLLEQYIDEKIVRQSTVEYGLVTVEIPSLQPNYLWKEQIPQGKLIDYILAGSTVFPAMKSLEIGKLRYVDGGFTDNLPVGMALEHGATHVIAVNLDAIGIIRKKPLSEADYIKVIQCSWDLGKILVFNRDNSKKIMRLGYLDTMKAFDVFEGTYFCFVKGEFDKRSRPGADMAGHIFDLDPEIIYKKYIFQFYLKNAVSLHAKEMEAELQGFSRTLKNKILDSFIKAKTTLSQKTLTLMIARSLMDKQDERNIFLTRPAMKLFRDEIIAANYLIKEGLI
jgi:Predicted esterase of the alpha-beta hydrolase superfamily